MPQKTNQTASNNSFYITHLYPEKMSIYGDIGNILALKKRLIGMGLEPVYQSVEIGEKLPEKTNFYFIGGGQDKDQYLVGQDLLLKKDRLIQDVENGAPLLAICGGYQLLGKSFVDGHCRDITGVNLFPVYTKAPDDSVKSRCTGNLVVLSWIANMQGFLIGFENHGGQTFFDSSQIDADNLKMLEEVKDKVKKVSEIMKQSSEIFLSNKEKLELYLLKELDLIQSSQINYSGVSRKNQVLPLGISIYGNGNNKFESLEGCVYKFAVGTYLHGSCLPKNPKLADWLIQAGIRFGSKVFSQKFDTKIKPVSKNSFKNDSKPGSLYPKENSPKENLEDFDQISSLFQEVILKKVGLLKKN